MGTLSGLLITWGYWGLLVAAFLAGSVLPFSSEAVMGALQVAGLDPWKLVVFATVGNSLGGMLNYAIGRMGKPEWIEKYLHVKKADLERAEKFMGGHGAWMGCCAIVPVVGDAITVVLGLMRANIFISFASMTVCKFLRYVLLMYGVGLLV